jgi:hypothetical protein
VLSAQKHFTSVCEAAYDRLPATPPVCRIL